MLKRRCVGFNTTPFVGFDADCGLLFGNQEVVVLFAFLDDDVFVVE